MYRDIGYFVRGHSATLSLMAKWAMRQKRRVRLKNGDGVRSSETCLALQTKMSFARH